MKKSLGLPWIKNRFSYQIGLQAEQKACDYLISRQLILVTRNYRCRGGEIDIIMRDDEQLVFVEVKYRNQGEYGLAAEYFTEDKRRKIQRAILHFMQKAGLNAHMTAHRIDVVAIDGDQVQWFKCV